MATSEADIQLGGNPPEKTQTVKFVSVKWDKSLTDEETSPILTGTITVGTALIAGFTMFILGGVEFSVPDNPQGQTNARFSYSGTRSAENIRNLFVSATELFLVFQNPR